MILQRRILTPTRRCSITGCWALVSGRSLIPLENPNIVSLHVEIRID